jgi:succinyl-CoA synthetase beta subunit
MMMTEHAGKSLLLAHGVPVPRGLLVRNSGQVERWHAGYPAAIKAQVSSGGRGKAGGVVRIDRPEDARDAAQRLFALEFAGERPSTLLIEPWVEHARELYLAVTVDGEAGGYSVLYASEGGIEVEDTPPIKYAFGAPQDFRGHALRALLGPVEPDAAVRERVVALARRLLFVATAADATTVEINPLAVLADGKLLALDAKVVRDEAAAFRHADIAAGTARARKREPRMVQRALAGNLMMVGLDGDIGLISGGAGMTMAGMDMLAAAGLAPACFLDCSSNPTPAGYQLAFDLLDAEARVKAILVSIFGGGTHVDRVAKTLKDLLAHRRSRKPVILRINGTGRERADAILEAAGLHNHPTLESAIEAMVATVHPR